MKIKKIFAMLLAVMIAMSTCVLPSFADDASPRLVMYETVEYVADHVYVDWEGIRIASASYDNRAYSTPATVELYVESNGSTTTELGAGFNGSYQFDFLKSELDVSLTFDVSYTRVWSRGTAISSTSTIDPHKFQVIHAYIPLVSVSGSIKYKVYNDYSPDTGYYYIYEPADADLIPAESHVHFVKEDVV